MSTTSKIIVSIASILFVAAISVLIYCYWPAITGTINNTKYYTEEDVNAAYASGVEDKENFLSEIEQLKNDVRTLSSTITVLEANGAVTEAEALELKTQINYFYDLCDNKDVSSYELNENLINIQTTLNNCLQSKYNDGYSSGYTDWSETSSSGKSDDSYVVLYIPNAPTNCSSVPTGEMEPTEYDLGGYSVTLANCEYSLVGYKFKGWNTNSDGTGTSYPNTGSALISSFNSEKILILYGQWEPIKYTVNFEIPSIEYKGYSNTITGSIPSMTVYYDEEIVFPDYRDYSSGDLGFNSNYYDYKCSVYGDCSYYPSSWFYETPSGDYQVLYSSRSVKNLLSEDNAEITLYLYYSLWGSDSEFSESEIPTLFTIYNNSNNISANSNYFISSESTSDYQVYYFDLSQIINFDRRFEHFCFHNEAELSVEVYTWRYYDNSYPYDGIISGDFSVHNHDALSDEEEYYYLILDYSIDDGILTVSIPNDLNCYHLCEFKINLYYEFNLFSTGELRLLEPRTK